MFFFFKSPFVVGRTRCSFRSTPSGPGQVSEHQHHFLGLVSGSWQPLGPFEKVGNRFFFAKKSFEPKTLLKKTQV